MSRSRSGSAVVLALLLLLVLQLLAHASVLSALGQARASRTALSVAQAEVGARAAVTSILGQALPEVTRGVPVGDRTLVARSDRYGTELRSGVLRLSRELWMVEGSAGPPSRVGGVRTGRVVWVLDPAARLGELAAVATVGGAASASSGGWWHEDRPSCVPFVEVLDSVFPPEGLPDTAPVPEVDSMWLGLGLVSWTELAGRASHVLSGTGTPGATTWLGECRGDDPWNLGDPVDSRGPCASHFPLAYAPGDLTLRGGVGQGVLAVQGDLDLDGGTRFHGMVITRGALRVGPEAELQGMVIALGGMAVAAGGGLVGSSCAAMRALEGVGGRLRNPVALPASGWIGPLPWRP